MIYAIISDIHANRYALAKVLQDAAKNGVQKIVCLGDIVGYGPEPKETLDQLRSHSHIVVAGNHDDAVSMRIDGEDFIDLAHDALERHRNALDSESIKYLHALPYILEIQGALITHGDFTDPPAFNYIETEEEARENFLATNHRLMFSGHTHEPGIFLIGGSGRVYKTSPQDFTLEQGKRYIVNPGSVGYPRTKDGKCFSSYVIYDSKAQTVEFRFIPFAVSSVMQRGKTPKWISKKTIFLGGLLLALIVGSLTWFLSPKEQITITQEQVAPNLVVETKTLEVSPEHKFFYVNLVLDKTAKSAPAEVHIRFLDKDNNELNKDVKTIKARAKGIMSIPKEIRPNCKQIEIILKKQKESDNIVLEEFAPQIVSDKKKSKSPTQRVQE